MYSNFLFKLIYLMGRASTTVGSFSGFFNPNTRVFFTTEKSIRKFVMSTIVVTIYLFLLCIKTFNMWMYLGGQDNPHFHTAYAFNCGLLFIWGIRMGLFFQHDNVIYGCNLIIRYVPQFQRKWIPAWRLSKYSRILDILVFFAMSVLMSMPLLSTTFFIFSRNNPLHPRNIMPDGFYLKDNQIFIAFLQIVLVTYRTWVACVSWYAVMLFVVIGFVYIVPIMVILQEFNINQKKHLSFASLRFPHNLANEIRTAQLLHKELSQSVGLTFVWIHMMLSHLSLFCNFAVLKNWHRMDLSTTVVLSTWSIIIQVIWGPVLEILGRFNMCWIKTIKSWKQMPFKDKQEAKFFSKFKKSLKPLYVGQAGVLTFKRLSVLKFFMTIIKGTFKALLTFGKAKQ